MPKKKEILPTGWEMKKFGDFLTESRVTGSNGLVARKITIKLYGRGIQEKLEKRSGSENTQYFKRFKSQFIYSKLDFLNGAFAIIPEHLDEFESTADLPAFDVSEKMNRYWLLFYVARESFYKSYSGEASGSRKARRVHPEEFLNSKFFCPPLPEQVRIASVLSSVDDLLSASRLMLERWKKIRNRTAEKLLLGNWEIKPLLKVCSSIRVGIASSATHAYAEKSEGVPILRNLNIKEGYIDASDLMYVSREFDIEHKKKRIQKNDVITVRTGNPGSSAVVTDEFYGCQTFTTLISTPKLEYLRPDYLCLWINSEEGKKFVQAGQAGGAQKNLNVGTLEKMPIPLPPLEEQERIVTILSSFDARIRSEEQYILQLENIKKGLMQFLLTGRYLLGAL